MIKFGPYSLIFHVSHVRTQNIPTLLLLVDGNAPWETIALGETHWDSEHRTLLCETLGAKHLSLALVGSTTAACCSAATATSCSAATSTTTCGGCCSAAAATAARGSGGCSAATSASASAAAARTGGACAVVVATPMVV